jgi:hypothetical protein
VPYQAPAVHCMGLACSDCPSAEEKHDLYLDWRERDLGTACGVACTPVGHSTARKGPIPVEHHKDFADTAAEDIHTDSCSGWRTALAEPCGLARCAGCVEHCRVSHEASSLGSGKVQPCLGHSESGLAGSGRVAVSC